MTAPARSIVGALCVLAAVCMALAALPRPVYAAQAAMTVELPAGKWKAVRLRNLPKNAVMAVAVQSSGPINVSLLAERDYRRFPQPQEPVFLGSVERSFSFTITIPETGHFYLVLDNRRSGDVRKVKLAIRAERGAAAPPPDVKPREERRRNPGERLQGT